MKVNVINNVESFELEEVINEIGYKMILQIICTSNCNGGQFTIIYKGEC